MLAALTDVETTAIAVAIGIVGGMLFAWLVRLRDHRTWVLARAPKLPIRALASGDDAWLTGTVRSSAPLHCPWFEAPCVAYRYAIEDEVTTTTVDKDGKTTISTSWDTVHSESDDQDFELDDGATIVVRMEHADNEALVAVDTDYETSQRRHTASLLEVDADVSVLGVKQPDGAFAGEREVPLLVTRQSPLQRTQSSARREAVLFTLAWVWPFLAGYLAVVLPRGRSGWSGLADPVAALAGVALATPFWAILTHNRLVRLRQQVRAAFRQVDVDLAVRAALVPNLVAVVRAASAHEHDLLRDLTDIRTGRDRDAAVAAEARTRATTQQVLLLHERYPSLRGDALYRDLHERLWATEEKLQHTRSLYNDVVTEWNNRIAKFPSVLVARLSGCRAGPPFAGDDAPLPPPLNDRDER